jgi:hypothetical protein
LNLSAKNWQAGEAGAIACLEEKITAPMALALTALHWVELLRYDQNSGKRTIRFDKCTNFHDCKSHVKKTTKYVYQV